MTKFVTLLRCSGKNWKQDNSHAFSEYRKKKKSWSVPFSFLFDCFFENNFCGLVTVGLGEGALSESMHRGS